MTLKGSTDVKISTILEKNGGGGGSQNGPLSFLSSKLMLVQSELNTKSNNTFSDVQYCTRSSST